MARKSKTKNRSNARKSAGQDGNIHLSRSDRLSTAAKRAPSKSKKTQKKGFWLWRLIRFFLKPAPRLAYWGLVFGLWGGIAAVGIIGFYAAKLPNASDWAIPQRPPNMKVVAMDASLIGNRGMTGGKALRLEEMSPYIAQAVIAIEDRRFHAHFGFDPIGFSRAMWRNISQKRMREGGSTITQQLAKNLFLTPDRTFGRKVQELILAVWLETKFTKAEILELYLNRVYFGSGATGVDAAARRYFGKSAKHVTISEAALLAGLLKAPSKYSPARNPKLAQKRARIVLLAMQREGYIKRGNIDINGVQPGEHARHFRSGPEHYVTDMVVKRVQELVGNVRQDIVVETTLSPYMMIAANEILNESLERHGKRRNVTQAALVSLAPDGALRALIGGRNYGKSQFNRAVEAQRQPGSAFKTFVWLNAMEQGQTPQTVVQDQPIRIDKWKPENYNQKYLGPVTLADAFAASINTVAAQLTADAGPLRIASTARRLGIRTKLKANASLALGTSEVNLMELVSAYVPFSNGGLRARPYLISRITTHRGKLLYQRPKPLPIEVVDPEALSKMNAMLRQVVDQGTGRAAHIEGHIAGGKTGTSQNFRDALFVGHTAHLVTGIWFGNDDNSPTKKLTGGSLPASAWKQFMIAALRDQPPRPLPGLLVFPSDLPITIPTNRPIPGQQPDGVSDDQQTASLKQRIQAEIYKKPSKTILDLINVIGE